MNCDIYIVKRGDTLYNIARRYNLTVSEIVAANPFITDPDYIFPALKLCIPGGSECPGDPGDPGDPGGPGGPGPGVTSIGFYNQEGLLLPQENGFAQLAPITIVRVTFIQPVSHGFLFFTPSGTETFLLTQLIGIAISDGSPVLQFQWQVPPALLGSVFVIGCSGQLCTQSDSINVYSPEA